MGNASENPAVFFEAEWTYRTWRGFLIVIASGLLAGLALFVAGRGFLHQQDIWQHYNWILASCFVAFGMFWASIAVLIFARILVGTCETSRIGTDGIKIARKHWNWNQLRFIRPTRKSAGDIMILIALKKKADRYFWIGRPLRQDEFEKLNEKMLPFLKSHYPHLLQ